MKKYLFLLVPLVFLALVGTSQFVVDTFTVNGDVTCQGIQVNSLFQVNGAGDIYNYSSLQGTPGHMYSDGHGDFGANVSYNNAGTFNAVLFAGSGASLTALPAGQLTGTIPTSSAVNLTNALSSQYAEMDNWTTAVVTAIPVLGSGFPFTNYQSSATGQGFVVAAGAGFITNLNAGVFQCHWDWAGSVNAPGDGTKIALFTNGITTGKTMIAFVGNSRGMSATWILRAPANTGFSVNNLNSQVLNITNYEFSIRRIE